MVRTIDAEARRKLLADAVWRLLRTGGLEAASVRAVANEAGLSAGSVRHFFTTQDELHVFAMGELMRRTTERVEAAMRKADGERSGTRSPEWARDQVRAGLHQLLPIDDESTADFQTHLQFVVKAVIHPPLAPTAQDSYRQMQEFYEYCVDLLARNRAADVGIDRRAAAQELAVVIDGLVLRRLTAPELVSVEAMIAILDDYLVGLNTEEHS